VSALGHPETNIKEVGVIPKQIFMIRRNLLVLSASVVAAALLITGCKKDSNAVSESSDAFSVATAKQWYANNAGTKQNNLNSSTRKKIGKFSPLWDKAFNSNDDKYEVIETPLSFDHNPGFASSSDQSKSKVNGITRMLILKDKKSGEIKSALMHVFSNSGTEDKNITYSKGKQDFTGTVFFTDLDGNFVNGWQYEKGKITGKSNNQIVSTNSGGKAVLPTDCTTVETLWFERDCTDYANGTSKCSPWVYIGSTFQTFCTIEGGGGGTGGGGYVPPTNDNCNSFKLQAQVDAVAAGGTPISRNLLIFSTGITSTSPMGEITREVNINWEFHENTFLSYRWHYKSFEKGVHKQVDGIWKWKSLTHNSETVVGAYPFSIDLIVNQATPSISASELLADMALKYTVKVTINCGVFSPQRSDVFNSSVNNLHPTLNP
jgi:hypothetical protein